MKNLTIQDPEKWKKFILKEATYIIPAECKGGICVDAGCNIGDFAMNHGSRFEKYVCFDVFQENVNECLKNTKDLGVEIEVNQLAVWSESNKEIPVMAYQLKEEPENFQHFGNSGNIGVIQYEGSSGEGWKLENMIDNVKTISIEDIIKKHGRINLLKVDVECAEYEFLLNKDLSQINYIVGEIHYRKEYSKEQLIDWICKTHDNIDGYFKLKTI